MFNIYPIPNSLLNVINPVIKDVKPKKTKSNRVPAFFDFLKMQKNTALEFLKRKIFTKRIFRQSHHLKQTFCLISFRELYEIVQNVSLQLLIKKTRAQKVDLFSLAELIQHLIQLNYIRGNKESKKMAKARERLKNVKECVNGDCISPHLNGVFDGEYFHFDVSLQEICYLKESKTFEP